MLQKKTINKCFILYLLDQYFIIIEILFQMVTNNDLNYNY
jgi:hypothetical protein